MKRLFFALVLFFSWVSITDAQTMKLYKDGAIIGQYSVQEIDSVIFCKDEDKPSKEVETVDLGLTIDGKQVLFAKSNLTSNGVTASEFDFGDFFAWGATTSLIQSYDKNGASISNIVWIEGKEEGFTLANSPYYLSGSSTSSSTNKIKYSKYNYRGSSLRELEPEDDAAHEILGEGWQIPTPEMWCYILTSEDLVREWDNYVVWPEGYSSGTTYQYLKIYRKDTPENYIILPCVYYIDINTCRGQTMYWTNTLGSDNEWTANAAHFANDGNLQEYVSANPTFRRNGCVIRPVFVK